MIFRQATFILGTKEKEDGYNNLTLSVLYGDLFFLDCALCHSGKSCRCGTVPMMHQIGRDHTEKHEKVKATMGITVNTDPQQS